MSRLKHRLEYAAIRAVQLYLLAMPHRCALFNTWILAWLTFNLIGIGRAEAMRRIRQVLGQTVPKCQVRRIAWLSWRNMCFNMTEMVRVTRITPQWIKHHTSGMEEAMTFLKDQLAQHGGAIIAVAHMGNWDLAGVACRQAGIDIFSIAGKQKNPYVNRWLDGIRGHSMDVLERGSSALRIVLRRLQQGGVFAILPDVRMPVKDLDIDFLGARANLGRGMAQFARRAQVPILPVTLLRQGWAQHTVILHDPVLHDPTLERDADLIRMTQIVADHITAAVMKHPEQWFWYNRRWVLMPSKPKKQQQQTP